MKRKAIVVGSVGQDGRLLSAQLRRRGYEVLGCVSSIPKCGGSEFAQVAIDITSQFEVSDFVRTFLPDEIYFLAAFH
jgi:GDPmannose 4,6-dehydratase